GDGRRGGRSGGRRRERGRGAEPGDRGSDERTGGDCGEHARDRARAGARNRGLGDPLERAARDRPGLVPHAREREGERQAQVLDRAPLLGTWKDTPVDRAAEIEGQVAAEAPERGE